jgi:hypothetical protein
MGVSDQKTRTISSRLAKNDYALAEQTCREQNCQSLSVFVRRAILAYCRKSAGLGEYELREMKLRLEVLEKQLREYIRSRREIVPESSREEESV